MNRALLSVGLASHYCKIQVAKATNRNLCGPMIAYIEVTKHCAFRCSFCDIWRATSETANEMTLEDFQHIAEDLNALGTKYVALFGGEALQRKDIFDILGALKRAGLGVVLDTNGYLLPEYHERVIRAGVDTLVVSMDSSRADVHDTLRGRKGSHRRIVDGLRAVQSHGKPPKLVINTLIVKQNFRELEEIVRLGTSIGVRNFRFLALNYIQPYALRGMQSGDLALGADEVAELEGVIERLIAYCDANGVTLNSHRFLKGIPTFYLGQHEPERCVAGYASIHIHNDGRLSFCSSLPADIGNVRQRRLVDIWRSPEFASKRAAMMSEPCDKCYVSCYIEQNHWFTPSFLLAKMLLSH